MVYRMRKSNIFLISGQKRKQENNWKAVEFEHFKPLDSMCPRASLTLGGNFPVLIMAYKVRHDPDLPLRHAGCLFWNTPGKLLHHGFFQEHPYPACLPSVLNSDSFGCLPSVLHSDSFRFFQILQIHSPLAHPIQLSPNPILALLYSAF